MKLYAAQRSRAIRQAGYDVATVGWVAAWLWLGSHVHDQISGSEAGARKIETSGRGLARNLHDAAGVLSHTPMIGDNIRRPVDQAANASTTLQHAGGQLADNLGKLGVAIGFEIALVPVLVAVFGWLFVRIGYARRAGRAAALATLPGGADLLALDALTRLQPRTLAGIGADVVSGWRDGDEAVIEALAAAYLASLGLRPLPPTGHIASREDTKEHLESAC